MEQGAGEFDAQPGQFAHDFQHPEERGVGRTHIGIAIDQDLRYPGVGQTCTAVNHPGKKPRLPALAGVGLAFLSANLGAQEVIGMAASVLHPQIPAAQALPTNATPNSPAATRSRSPTCSA